MSYGIKPLKVGFRMYGARKCIWHSFFVRDGAISALVTEIVTRLKARHNLVTRAEIIPSRTLNNAICISSEITRIEPFFARDRFERATGLE